MLTSRWYQIEADKAMQDCTDNGVVVLPTGSGKTHVIQRFTGGSNGRILLLSHVKEILQQNFSTLAPLGNVGLYSSGLGLAHQDYHTVAGIQTVHRRIKEFSGYDKVIIDEAHMVNNEGMYNDVLSHLGIPYIGLTATPWRLSQGLIYGEQGMYDRLIYEAPAGRLIKEGYLTKIVPKGDADEFDTKGLKTVGGDFNIKDAALRYNRPAMTKKIVSKLVKYKDERKHWLIFCIDIEHAEQVARFMNEAGISCGVVHSKSPRDETLLAFQEGKIQAVANVNILTTGFDFPGIDMLVVLRPTKSPTLHIQMLGRGSRISPDKKDCLLKDFAGNTARLGFIDDIDPYIKPKGKGTGELKFAKTCPECEMLHPPAVRKCPCGHVFDMKHNLSADAYDGKKHKPAQWYNVDNIVYLRHAPPGKTPCLKVIYYCGIQQFVTYQHPEHTGYAKYKTNHWLTQRLGQGTDLPTTVDEILKIQSQLRRPTRIQVDTNQKFPSIRNAVFEKN